MNTIKIGFQWYSVVLDDLHNRACDAYGLTNHETGKIHIQEGLTPAQYMNTFIHELLHACFNSSGFEKVFNSEQEEQVVNMFANTFMAVIIDNPELLSHLQVLSEDVHRSVTSQ